jgi:hypothetical protein
MNRSHAGQTGHNTATSRNVHELWT